MRPLWLSSIIRANLICYVSKFQSTQIRIGNMPLINMQYFKKKDRKKDYLFKKYSWQSFLKSIVQIKCYKVSILMQAWWLTISSLFNFEIWYFWPQTFIYKNPPLLNRYSSIAVLQDTCIHFLSGLSELWENVRFPFTVVGKHTLKYYGVIGAAFCLCNFFLINRNDLSKPLLQMK